MKKAAAYVIALSLAGSAVFGQISLSPEAKDWLDTVAPIITRMEREVFLKLTSGSDRDKFIQFFWKQRDPRPDTAENEFYKEYMARISFADRTFHDDTSQKGSRTERGYYYRLLGAPLERHLFTSYSQFWPAEVWLYKGEEQYGLPPYFNLMFYQPQGMGPYRLYSPTVDGPERLAVPTMSNSALNRNSAYKVIKEVAAEVAGASLSLIPGERPLTSASLSSDSLMAGVRALPEKKYSDAYARSYLDFKDHVEIEYSHNYIDCHALVRVYERSGQFFVDWTVEPSKMNFDTVGNAYFASYELVIKLERPDGTTLLEKTEELPFRVTPEQYEAHERQGVAFQDVLPVIPGESRLFLLLKNKTAKDFMSFQARLSVPGEIKSPQLTDLLLYHGREAVPENQKKSIQPFAIDGRRYAFNARNQFLPGEKLGCLTQALRLAGDPAEASAVFLFEIVSMGRGTAAAEPAKPNSAPISRRFAARDVLNAKTGGVDLGPFELSALTPGYYQAVLTLLDAGGRPLQTRKENFVILSAPLSVLPWVFARQQPPFPSSDQLYLLSSQYFLSRDYLKAKDLLDKAAGIRNDPRTKLLRGRTLFALGRFKESIGVLESLYKEQNSREAGKVLALDHSSLGDWAAALAICEELLRESTEVSVLNLAGECHLRLNAPDKAASLWKKSLELDPAQPAIKALLEKTKK